MSNSRFSTTIEEKGSHYRLRQFDYSQHRSRLSADQFSSRDMALQAVQHGKLKYAEWQPEQATAAFTKRLAAERAE